WRNTISWKAFSLSFNITGRFGHYFRRATVGYDMLFRIWDNHEDFSKRWQKPGDEQRTSVPSMVYPANPNRDTFYANSEATVEKAGNLRLKDVYFSYMLDRSFWSSMPVERLQLYLYANNLGFLWRATNTGIDPDTRSEIPTPRVFSIGIKAN